VGRQRDRRRGVVCGGGHSPMLPSPADGGTEPGGDVAWTGCPLPPRSPPGCAPAATSSSPRCSSPAPTSPARRRRTSWRWPAGSPSPCPWTGHWTNWTRRPCRRSTSSCSPRRTASPPPTWRPSCPTFPGASSPRRCRR
jgi:hypothetical protein